MSAVFNTNAPIQYGSATTKSDDAANNFPVIARGLMIEVAGPVALVQVDDSVLVLAALVPGVIYNLPHKRINSTGTTQTSFISFF
jgi:hypothetical protein